MLRENVKRRLDAAGRLLEHTEAAGIGNAAKSSYYRSAIILLCTIIESLVYELVKKNTAPPKHIIGVATEYVEKFKIPAGALGTQADLSICEKARKNIEIDDHAADFGKLNLFLKKECTFIIWMPVPSVLVIKLLT